MSNVTNLTMQGFHVGATMENTLSEDLSLESGLLVSLKGFKIDEFLDGIEFGLWQIGVYYDFGFTDISSDTNPENTIKNRLWKISVGYKLGSK